MPFIFRKNNFVTCRVMENPEVMAQSSKIYKGRLYKTRTMIIAGLLGGPPASAYIIAHNFKVLGERKKMYLTWLVMLLFMAAVFVVDGFIIQLPNIVILAIALGISMSFMNRFQADAIDEYIDSGHLSFSNWHGLLVGIVSLLIISVVIFGSIELMYIYY